MFNISSILCIHFCGVSGPRLVASLPRPTKLSIYTLQLERLDSKI